MSAPHLHPHLTSPSHQFTAVAKVPVKEEEEEYDEGMLTPGNDKHPDSTLPHPTSTSTTTPAAGASAASASRHAVKQCKSNGSMSSHRINPTWPSDDNKASKSYADDLEEEEEPLLDSEEGGARVLVDADMIPIFSTFPRESSPHPPHRHRIATPPSHHIVPRPSPFHR